MARPAPEHSDKLGRPLQVGDCVAYPSHNTLEIGTVQKLNPKLVGIERVGGKWRSSYNKYPHDLVRIDGPEVTMYLLKMAHK